MNCPICTSEDIVKGHKIEKDKYIHKEVQYYNCLNCELRFVYPQDQELLIRFYNQAPLKKLNLKKEIIFRLPYSKRHKYLFKFLKGLKKGTLLDVGCSEGKFSWLMKLKGWKVFAVEPCNHLANFARKTYGLTVKKCYLENLSLNYKFDLVVISATLEHFFDQFECLKKLKEHTKENGGYIAIRIPHYLSDWYSGGHLFLHSKKSLQYLFDQVGLKIVKIDELEREYFVLGAIKD